MSGTPRNDKFQEKENSICTHRLFSLHGSYEQAVYRWLGDVIKKPDLPYPKFMMLDSGAFTAWNKGHHTELSEVIAAYDRFTKVGDPMFEQTWMVNLDVIPGEKGRTATEEELKAAIVTSDENFKRLVDRYGERVLPVFHQDEPEERLFEIAEMSKYFCISPRNDVHEARRCSWSKSAHQLLGDHYPNARTHGLATTGNDMIREVPWHSIDSAAWVLHAGFGMVDIFEGIKYRNYFVSYEGEKEKTKGIHIDSMNPNKRQRILNMIDSYNFTLKEVQTNSRIRTLVCMGELNKYATWAEAHQANPDVLITTQQGLLENI
jgi:hypothetical protein